MDERNPRVPGDAMKIKRNQKWKSKTTGRTLIIINRATGNRHWTIKTDTGKSHHIHEGTLLKFYKPVMP